MDRIITTGVLGLDVALGDGLPHGRIVEIYGPEKCGKTALCLSILSGMQKSGGVAAYVDIDQTLDASRAARFGIEVQKVIYARPENALQAIEITRMLARSGGLDLIVVDSVAGLMTYGVYSPVKSGGNSASRLFSQAVRELDVIARETGMLMVFTNELRERAGVIYGVPVTTPGGIALKLHAVIRLEMIPQEPIRSGGTTVGERAQVKVIKPKSSVTFPTIFINIMYNGVVSRVHELFDLAIELKIINNRGSFYSFGEKTLGRGRDAALSSLLQQGQLADEIEAAIRKQFLPSTTASQV